MKLSARLRLNKHIFRLLKINEITYPIGRTSKGNLGLTFNDKNDDFDMTLDSIPLSTQNALDDENNIELKMLLTKYLFENEDIIQWPSTRPVVSNEPMAFIEGTPRKGGRPKGSKNGTKAN